MDFLRVGIKMIKNSCIYSGLLFLPQSSIRSVDAGEGVQNRSKHELRDEGNQAGIA